MNCPNCNSPVPEGAAFCGICGFKFQPQPQPQPQIQQPWNQAPQVPAACPNCGTKLDGQSAFCPECGMPVAQMMAAVQPGPQGPQGPQYGPQGPGPEGEKPKKVKQPKEKKEGGNKKTLMIIIIAVLALVVIGALIFLLTRGGGSKSSGSKNDKFVMYLKDDEMYYYDFSKKDPFQVTTRLFADVDMEDMDDPEEIGTSLAAFTYITDDGKTIYFVDRIKDSDDGATLYARSLTKRDEEPVKIDSKIYEYTFTEDEKYIIYLNSSETLYQYDIKKGEKTKLASDVYSYRMTPDGSEILYLNNDYTLYLLEAGSDKVKISSDVSSYMLTEDGNTIYYVKDDGTLYKKEAGSDKEKIASDVQIRRMYPTGEIYYLTVEENEVTADTFVKDDKQGDSSYDGLRESLKNTTVIEYVNTYWYYDGTEATELVSSYDYGDNYMLYYYTSAPELPALRMQVMPQADVKLPLSEVSPSWIAYDVRDAAQKETTNWVFVGKDGTDLGPTATVSIQDDGTIYYQEKPETDKDGNQLEYADIYKLTYAKGKFTTPELVAEEVYRYGWTVMEGDLYYFVDYKDGTGDFYVNDTLIDYDVYGTTMSYLFLSEPNHVYYISDYSEKSETASVSLWDGKDSTVVADDVAFPGTNCGKGVTYLQDYSFKGLSGDLYWFDGKDTVLVDDEVFAIVPYQVVKDRARGQRASYSSSYYY